MKTLATTIIVTLSLCAAQILFCAGCTSTQTTSEIQDMGADASMHCDPFTQITGCPSIAPDMSCYCQRDAFTTCTPICPGHDLSPPNGQ